MFHFSIINMITVSYDLFFNSSSSTFYLRFDSRINGNIVIMAWYCPLKKKTTGYLNFLKYVTSFRWVPNEGIFCSEFEWFSWLCVTCIVAWRQRLDSVGSNVNTAMYMVTSVSYKYNSEEQSFKQNSTSKEQQQFNKNWITKARW